MLKKKNRDIHFTSLILLLLFFFASCSSVPKRPAEVFVIQSMTETQLKAASREADHGNYANALSQLTEAWRLAVSTDRPNLRIRVSLSRGNVLFYMGKRQEAVEIWKNAEKEAGSSGDTVLAAASRIYQLRSLLTAENAEDIRTRIQAEFVQVRSDKLFTALAWTIAGLSEKELGRFSDAEKSIRNALSIHESGRYLEQAAYDWYLIASVRSVAGDYAGALSALDSALGFDRRAENTFGLGMDWSAYGEVLLKMENKADAETAWRRSAEIFRARNLEENALAVEKRIAGMYR